MHHRHAGGGVHRGPRGGARPPASRRLDRGDAAKGTVGRKRAALVDAEGHWLAVAVVPASVQDRDAPEALDAGKARWPSLREAVYDGAFAAERCREWSNRHGMRHRVVARDPQAEGFVVLARRWVVIACTELPNRGSSGPRRSSEGGCARWAMTTAVRG